MINIALLGFGTVGGGVAEVITKNEKIISARLGDKINIKYILDLREFPSSPFADRIVHDFNTILNDPEVSIVAEMMGGVHPAADFSRAALDAGKSVVTSNKAVVAACGDELLALARKRGVRYLFEASVGGGIPIIRPLTDDLASNEINSVCGILNGTTNFILNEMSENGSDFDSVLKQAQEKGYAEADPTADVDGFDAARKIIILAALAYGKLMPLESISIRGIRSVTRADVTVAEQLGCRLKLIADVRLDADGRILATVAPRFVRTSCPLAYIDGVFNGVLVRGNMVGNAMFYGPGAGKLPTASAVVADIIDAAERKFAAPPRLDWVRAEEKDISPVDPANEGEYFCHIFDNAAAAIAAANAAGNTAKSVDAAELGENGVWAVLSNKSELAGSVRRYAFFE
ncbi:MAG: homoserine dehydrogenase [Clostridia bacterium]|nr:homoserine dehydrogenase [Clostridia bacterium]